jgi:antitoxin VapB
MSSSRDFRPFPGSSALDDPPPPGRIEDARERLTRATAEHRPRRGSEVTDRERRVRLFRNGRNQALRIPREFEFDADEAILRRDGERLIIEPVKRKGLLALLATLEPIEATFADADEGLPPVEPVVL